MTSRTHVVVPTEGPAPIAIVGTTASGKSAAAMEVARRLGDVELVSVDSMQVYRGMDIGTAKPTAAERAEVPHHGLDLVDPWEPFEVFSFQQEIAGALRDISSRGRRAVLVGGTGLYLRAVIDGFEIPGRFAEVRAELDADPDTPGLHRRLRDLDPRAADRMEPSNRRRIVRALEVTLGSGRPFSSYGPGVDAYPPTPVRLLGIRLPAEVTAARIEARYHQQMADGFLAEVERLLDGPPLSHTAAQALGYRELLGYLRAQRAGDPDGPSLEVALEEALRRTRAFARRQRSWFARDPRITWLDAVDPGDVVDPIVATAEAWWTEREQSVSKASEGRLNPEI
jgi:tRNA dimethylallyltransferase